MKGHSCEPDDLDHVEKLLAAWESTKNLGKERVLAVSRAFYSSGIDFDGAVRILGCSAAELQATLSLASLSEEDLTRLFELEPAITTWSLFGATDEKGFEAGINALKMRKNGDSSFMTVYNAVRSAAAPDVYQILGGLSAKELWHIAHKAKEYKALRDKDRRFLGDQAKLRGTGKSLTQRQLEYLKGLLTQLAEREVISIDSKDNDQELCNKILKALGRI